MSGSVNTFTLKSSKKRPPNTLSPDKKRALKELRRVAHVLKEIAFEAITDPADTGSVQWEKRLHRFNGIIGMLNAVEETMSKGANAWPPRPSGAPYDG